jgi:hypothetical protein
MRMRAIQMTAALHFQDDREPNWMAHTEFTLRPRFARTGVVGHDIFEVGGVRVGANVKPPY